MFQGSQPISQKRIEEVFFISDSASCQLHFLGYARDGRDKVAVAGGYAFHIHSPVLPAVCSVFHDLTLALLSLLLVQGGLLALTIWGQANNKVGSVVPWASTGTEGSCLKTSLTIVMPDRGRSGMQQSTL